MTVPWQQHLDSIVEDLTPELIALRRELHTHPEPSGEETQTTLKLYELLGGLGLELKMGPDGLGVLADTPGEGKRIAFRGDIDALRIHDEKQVPYRSQCDGVMHACGHDAHATIAIGTAKALALLAETATLPCPVSWRAILQPSEETARGARAMMSVGALDDVSQIFSLHVDPTRAVGTVGLREGPITAHCDSLNFVVTGEGGHGARPHESKDPIAAAAQLINALYQFVPRATDSHDAVVISIGCLQGGENPNVIPEQVVLGGTLRTLDYGVRAETIAHIERVCRGVAEVTRTAIQLDIDESIPSVSNDPLSEHHMRMAAVDLLGPKFVHTIAKPSMGSEDFACYLDEVKGGMFRLGTASDPSKPTLLHTPRFDIDERAIAVGVKIMARAVVMASDPKNYVIFD